MLRFAGVKYSGWPDDLMPRQKPIDAVRQFSPTEQTYGIDQAASGVADFFVKVFVPIEIVVAGRIGLIVTQVAVEQGSATGRDQSHIRQPIGEATTERFRARGIAVNDDGE